MTGQARWLGEVGRVGIGRDRGGGAMSVDLSLYSPQASEDSGPGVGKIHRGDVFKACELGDDPPSDP